ncbi:hypothetical protein RRG08_057680 [Elysia crispata]|uniref:Uncharacterized protein n=1 Tax=Elysia crispata TaxID=231223 RepID=A0AAE1DXG4_9GAST|nr:hypothetical protein RRG08_057680 [Elysia crispata]
MPLPQAMVHCAGGVGPSPGPVDVPEHLKHDFLKSYSSDCLIHHTPHQATIFSSHRHRSTKEKKVQN